MDRFDHRLEQLFSDYRDSVPVPDPSRDFMPGLWERIDTRRNLTFRMKRYAQLFVGASALICILMTGMSVVSSSSVRQPHATYVDVLAEAQPAENLAALGILAHADGSEASH